MAGSLLHCRVLSLPLAVALLPNWHFFALECHKNCAITIWRESTAVFSRNHFCICITSLCCCHSVHDWWTCLFPYNEHEWHFDVMFRTNIKSWFMTCPFRIAPSLSHLNLIFSGCGNSCVFVIQFGIRCQATNNPIYTYLWKQRYEKKIRDWVVWIDRDHTLSLSLFLKISLSPSLCLFAGLHFPALWRFSRETYLSELFLWCFSFHNNHILVLVAHVTCPRTDREKFPLCRLHVLMPQWHDQTFMAETKFE